MFKDFIKEWEMIDEKCKEMIKRCDEQIPHWKGNIYYENPKDKPQ